MYRILFALLLIISTSSIAQAAFPIKEKTCMEEQGFGVNNILYTRSEQYAKNYQQKIAPQPLPFGYRMGKSHILAILLCLFLGPLGAHDFYLGYYIAGIVKIILTALITYMAINWLPLSLGAIAYILPPFLLLSIWLLVDFVTICVKTKLPKDAEYN
jgi:hypothetical protein